MFFRKKCRKVLTPVVLKNDFGAQESGAAVGSYKGDSFFEIIGTKSILNWTHSPWMVVNDYVC